jgi:tryptophan synthase beta chain
VATQIHDPVTDYFQYPDVKGHFGQFGGLFVAETLMGPLKELREAYERYATDPDFVAEYEFDLKHFVGRPSPIYLAKGLTEKLGGAQIP